MPKGRFREKIKSAELAITFNDLIILPSHTSVEPSEVDVSTYVTMNYKLNIPFVSSPMDTVTGPEMAIALARQGGLGVLHRNCSAEEEVEMAKRVKRAESFIIRDVVVIHPDATVADALKLMQRHEIHGLPVVDDKGYLIGIVTWRDVRFADLNLKVRDVMTGKDRLITAPEEITLEEAKSLMHKHRVEKLPIVDEHGKLKGLITIKDLELKGKYPNAVRDEEGRLLCAAAVSPFDLKRAKMLDKYVDILVIDVAHFHNDNVIRATKRIMREVSADMIIGNIGTYEAAVDCISELEEVHGMRVGIGSGSICTTTVVTRIGAPTLYAVASVADAIHELGAKIPIIADGGIRNPGDVALALSVGASCVMMGNVFAGCKESPGRLVALEGRYYKEYYGMGSERARRKRYALDRYNRPAKGIPEGVEGWVPYRGTVEDVVREFVDGLKAAMGYVGARTIPEMWEKAQLAFISPAGMQEMRPHDILLPKRE
ncbi:MAG: IMP dehydrogenase [Candidatus Baldrarchaeia archaeon]